MPNEARGERHGLGEKRFYFLPLLPPLLYFSMYLPLWQGRQMVNGSAVSETLLLFQGFCLLCGFARLLLYRRAGESRGFPEILEVFSVLLFCFSALLFCFVGLIFLLELLEIPWFPPQR